MPERKMKVLLVEDNAGLLDTLADILRVMDMEVDTAPDAPVAFGLLNEGRYDVAVVDMVLPGSSGVEVNRRLKACSPAHLLMRRRMAAIPGRKWTCPLPWTNLKSLIRNFAGCSNLSYSLPHLVRSSSPAGASTTARRSLHISSHLPLTQE